MVTWKEYLASILQKILDSYSVLQSLNDKPGDLAIIEKELLKINGFFNVLVTKLDSENYDSKNLETLKSKLNYYLESYYFEKEIQTMTPLYSEDTNRIKNIRLKILESLQDKKLITNIETIIEDL
ncbi:hypothetical protein NsoK4_03990 [Nitrosopumilus sp. K4]|uniref:hypothetical protein n=1 Tax=Nitrosopumilus sp. K4 TaxID=2795383 RepID=UPI001BA7B5C1|nr:hypothetical protein [Nitrosopumilus sp. K4]QUC65413.1 hypothetical protein NsoK4_03990 [Nitrosopumilus sp. K4]